MRKLAISGIIPLLLFVGSCGTSGNKTSSESASVTIPESEAAVNTNKKYEIKSGIVNFESSGMGIKTKTILYFDDFGSKEAEEKYDEDGNVKEIQLCDGTNRYTIIPSEKIAYSNGSCYRGIAYRFDWEEVSGAESRYKATKLPNITIAGKDCESFSLESSGQTIVYAGWNNVCLLIDQTSRFGPITYKAVSFEENPSIPADKLNIPAGYQTKQPSI